MKKLFLCLLILLSPSAWAVDCYISEYAFMGREQRGNDPVPVAGTLIASQFIDDFTTEVDSAAFNTNTRFIRLICTAVAHFEIGATPTATVADPYIPANTPEYFGVVPGQVISLYDGSS